MIHLFHQNLSNFAIKKYSLVPCALISIILVGCQSTTTISTAPVQPQTTIEITPEPKVKITPYPDSGIKRESQPLPTPVPKTQTRVILSEQKTTPLGQLKDGKNIPAYHQLMQNYLNALKQNNLVEAEKNLLQAQRIAPQSADVYRELARLANIRKQGTNAEAFARKGLTFAQNNTQHKQLWEQILQSAKLRNHSILIQQASQQISKY